jgi:hypothetical protein
MYPFLLCSTWCIEWLNAKGVVVLWILFRVRSSSNRSIKLWYESQFWVCHSPNLYHTTVDKVLYTVTRMRGAARFVSEDNSFTFKCWGITRVFDRFLCPSFYAVQPVFLHGTSGRPPGPLPGSGLEWGMGGRSSVLNMACFIWIKSPTFLGPTLRISWVLHWYLDK